MNQIDQINYQTSNLENKTDNNQVKNKSQNSTNSDQSTSPDDVTFKIDRTQKKKEQEIISVNSTPSKLCQNDGEGQFQIPPFKHLNKKSDEEGFEGYDSSNWFNEEDFKKTVIAPMHAEDPTDLYFDSYSHYYIHEEMIKDHVRTSSYEKAMMKNSEVLKDKIVLDIGCGTGILSIFAARAGAKHVYGIDNAEIAEYAKHIVKKNGFADKITIIKGKVEEIELPVEQVDVIISEWMGYFLLYESMLDTVLFARDKWLVKDTGIIMPDKFNMFIAGFEDKFGFKTSKQVFWKEVYGIDMEEIGNLIYIEPTVEAIEMKQIKTDVCTFYSLDLNTCKKEDAVFANKYCITMQQEGKIDGLITWFDCEFRHNLKVPLRFTTGPFTHVTHWKQTLFYIDGEYDLEKGDKMFGSLAIRKNKKHPRELDIKISFNCQEDNGQEIGEKYIQYFQMT